MTSFQWKMALSFSVWKMGAYEPKHWKFEVVRQVSNSNECIIFLKDSERVRIHERVLASMSSKLAKHVHAR